MTPALSVSWSSVAQSGPPTLANGFGPGMNIPQQFFYGLSEILHVLQDLQSDLICTALPQPHNMIPRAFSVGGGVCVRETEKEAERSRFWS